MLIKFRSTEGEGRPQRSAALWLQDRAVGEVSLDSRDGPWRFGRFSPVPAFAPFAPTFSQWSRLMHLQEDSPLTDAQRDELTLIERSIDRLHAWLVEPDGTRRRVFQLNIDDDRIEWKER